MTSFTPGHVQVAPDSTGAKVDGAALTEGPDAVIRQIVSIGDPATAAGVAPVMATNPVGTEAGLVVRPITADGVSLLATSLTTPGPTAAISTLGFSSLFLQITGTWRGSIWFEGSNDQSAGSWSELMVMSLDEFVGQDIINANGQFALKAGTPWVRLNVLTLTGTAVVSVVGRVVEGEYGADRLTQALDQRSGVSLSVVPGAGGQQASQQSFPIAIASDQAQDLFVGGPAAMFGLNAVVAQVDTLAGGTTSYRSFSAQVNGNVGVSAGAITFQGSNDGQNWVAIPVYDQATITGTPIQAAITIAASTFRFFTGKCQFRYLRILATTGFTGSWIQAFLRLSILDIAPQVLSVGQPTAANLNATVAQATQANLNATVYQGTAANLQCTPVQALDSNLRAQISTNPNGGITGVLAVGGNVALGSAPTSNPAPVGGRDAAGLTRMVLTDTAGRIQVSDTGLDASNTVRNLGMVMGLGAVPALSVQMQGNAESYDLFQALLMLLQEVRVTNQILYDLPLALQGGGSLLNDPAEYRADLSISPL